MKDLIDRQLVLALYKKYQPHLAINVIEFGKELEKLSSAQPDVPDTNVGDISEEPEERPITEDDYTYCAECDHVEMCRWYPMYGCEFKSKPSAEPEIIRCKECKEFRRWIDTDITFCDRTEYEVKEDDFCSKAERRTDEQVN